MVARKKAPVDRPQSSIVAERRVFFMGSKGGMVVQVRQRESDPPFIRIGKWSEGNPTQSLIINKENHWLKIKRFLDVEFAQYMGWAGFSIPETEIGGYISVEEHDAAIKKLEGKNKKLLTETREMEKNIARMRRSIQKKQEEKYRTKIPEHKRTLAEFRKMVDDGVSEQTIHPFLKENYWIFGAGYVGRTNQPQIGFKHRGDFMLEKADGYHDIVELKSPRDDVFTKHGKLSGTTKDAISQMITYLHKCDITYSYHLSELGMDILKPQGFIIVGKRDAIESGSNSHSASKKGRRPTTVENLQIHNAFLKNITVMTFDQLYENARQTILRFEGDAKS